MTKLTAIVPATVLAVLGLLATACGSTAEPVSQAPQSPETQVAGQAPQSPAPASDGTGRTTSGASTTGAAAATATPATPVVEAPELTLKGSMTSYLTGDVHTASVKIVVLDAAGHPAANAEVAGTFTDRPKETVVLTTDADGIALGTAIRGPAHQILGFNVTAVTYLKAGVMSAAKTIDAAVSPTPCCPFKPAPSL